MADFNRDQVRFGLGGLDLRRAADVVAPDNALRLNNVQRNPEGGWTARFGQTAFATSGGTTLHSIRRGLDATGAGTSNLYWGVDTSLFAGLSGALSSIDTGYSGNPLALAPWRVEQSGEGWMIVGDRSKVRKVRVRDNLVLPIGLPAPGAAATTALATAATLTADSFNGSAGSYTAGTLGSGAAASLSDVAPGGDVANAMRITTNAGASTGPYYNSAARAVTLDLSTYGAGVPLTDDDYLHLWLRMDQPNLISEIRVYFVASAITTTAATSALPGSSSTVNTDAYMKSFRPSDLNPYVQDLDSSTSAVTTEVVRRAIRKQTGLPNYTKDPDGAVPVDSRDTNRNVAAQNTPGANVWTEWGSVDIPLRRGDFTRIGTGSAFDWSTVTGIIISVHVAGSTTGLTVELSDMYFTGGSGPDAGDPDTEPYDYRVTNYDPRTGAEGNPSPIQAESLWLRPLRRSIVVTPAAAYGDAAVRQRVYRRGGTLTDDWYFVGVNSSDGGAFNDDNTDAEAEAAGTVDTDHFQAVPSVDAAGAAVLAQPTPYWWGPINDLMFTAGDPNRPGSVYYCYPGQIDHWGADNYIDVCAPSELILNGFVFSGQSFVWSTQRLYALIPNLIDTLTVTAQPTPCAKAPVGPWAFTVGPSAVYFWSYDGIYQTNGGDAINLSDDWLRPLFQGQSSNGLLPIDFTAVTDFRCQVYLNELWCQYRDTGGTNRTLIYSLLDRSWRVYTFGDPTAVLYTDLFPGINRLLMGTRAGGAGLLYSGTADSGNAIACSFRTPTLTQGDSEIDKLYSDLTIDADRQSTTLTVTPYLTNETVAATALTINSGSGRQRYLYNFATQPTRASNIALDVTWSSSTQRPIVYLGQVTWVPVPALAQQRGIDWENLGDSYLTGLNLEFDSFGASKTIEVYGQLNGAPVLVHTSSIAAANGRRQVDITIQPPVRGHLFRYIFTDSNPYEQYSHSWVRDDEPSEQTNWNQNYTPLDGLQNKYIKGVALDCDTFAATKTVQVQGDGAVLTTLSVVRDGRGILHFGFPASQARLMRLYPTDANPGRLYSVHWIYDDEPFVLTAWDSNWEDHGDSYYTGLNIEVNTFGIDKVFNFYVDQVLVSSQTVNANGRTLVHITLPPARGHLYRWTSTDSVVAQIYTHTWMLEAEPSEQANWNQNYTVAGIQADKAVKGVILECDTFGADKTVEVQIDGVTHTTLTANANGRKVLQFSFDQGIGRVLRLLPTDSHPGRLYHLQWIFDTEPLALTRWETQRVTHGIPTWQVPTRADVTLKSTADVTYTLTSYRQNGTSVTKSYTIPSTGGTKQQVYVPFEATKGVLFHHLLTSSAAFWLYREESSVSISPWGAQELTLVHPFGNDDNDPSRGMGVSALQAATPGGALT